jgi:sulfide:quinone oxidoreductase
MKTVLILGAGFAGLELATRLSDEVPDEVDVTIVDGSDAFVFGFSKLDLMFGRKDLTQVRRRCPRRTDPPRGAWWT